MISQYKEKGSPNREIIANEIIAGYVQYMLSCLHGSNIYVTMAVNQCRFF